MQNFATPFSHPIFRRTLEEGIYHLPYSPWSVDRPTKIDQLPSEVLSRIFWFTIGTLEDENPSRRFFSKQLKDIEPFLFLGINKWWRSVAFHDKSLWTNVRAPEALWGTNQAQMPLYLTAQVKFICQWLAQSSPFPLHLTHSCLFACRDSMNKEAKYVNKWARAFLEIFLEHEARWVSLDIVFNESLLSGFLSRLRRTLADARTGSRPILAAELRRLRIHLDPQEQFAQKDLLELFQWVKKLPKLEELEFFVEAQLGLREIMGQLPYEGLKHLRDRWATDVDEVWEIISRCTAATSVVFESTSYHGPFQWEEIIAVPPQSHRLANLTTLTLDRVSRPLEILQRLVLPNLETLRIRRGLGDTPSRCQIIELFMTGSKCPLRTFCIDDKSLSARECVEILNLPVLTSVRELIFERQFACNFEKQIFDTEGKLQAFIDEIVKMIDGQADAFNPNFRVPCSHVWVDFEKTDKGKLRYRFGRRGKWEDRESEKVAFAYKGRLMDYFMADWYRNVRRAD